MKKENGFLKRMGETYKNSSKPALVVYIVIRTIMLICLVMELLVFKNYHNAFLCVVSLLLISIPTFIKSTTSIRLPSALEITVVVFVFAAEILGEIGNFYHSIPFWDTILHTTNGFFAAAVGFGFIDLLNKHAKRTQMSALFVSLVSFCFSMTVGVVWEFAEFSVDRLFKFDTQKDVIITDISTVTLNPDGKNSEVKIENIDHTVLYDKDGNVLATIENGYLDVGIYDTMEDLFVNFVGAVVFSVLGYFYIRKRDKFEFVEELIPYGHNEQIADGIAEFEQKLTESDKKDEDVPELDS